MQRAAVGFRVKSGWAVAVLVAGSASTPVLLDVRRVQLSDPSVPDSTQPFHAGLETPAAEGLKLVARLVEVVERFTQKSVVDLLTDYGDRGLVLIGTGVVVGSQVDPRTIHNDHIRAHAEEGRLFRNVVVDAAKRVGLKSTVVAEKNLLAEASKLLRRSSVALKNDLIALGRGVGRPWRSEQKAAALAAWMALV